MKRLDILLEIRRLQEENTRLKHMLDTRPVKIRTITRRVERDSNLLDDLFGYPY